jgi:excisionase family DNA binding protein
MDWKLVSSEELREVLTTQQAAKVLGLSVSSVQKMVISGELEAWTTPGGHRRIDRNRIERLLQSRNSYSGLRTLHPHRSMRILLAEDDPIQVTFFESILKKLPYTVELTVAQDASMALIQLERQRPDLVVTDLMMEPFDGYHLIRTLEMEPAYYPIDVVVLSALEKTEAQTGGNLPDWVTFYKKPVPPDRMIGYLDSMQTRVIKRFSIDDSSITVK